MFLVYDFDSLTDAGCGLSSLQCFLGKNGGPEPFSFVVNAFELIA